MTQPGTAPSAGFLLWLTLGYVIWAIAFGVFYGVVSVMCLPVGGLGFPVDHRLILIFLFLVMLAAAVIAERTITRRHARIAQQDRTRRFLLRLSRYGAITAGFSICFSLVGIWFLPICSV